MSSKISSMTRKVADYFTGEAKAQKARKKLKASIKVRGSYGYTYTSHPKNNELDALFGARQAQYIKHSLTTAGARAIWQNPDPVKLKPVLVHSIDAGRHLSPTGEKRVMMYRLKPNLTFAPQIKGARQAFTDKNGISHTFTFVYRPARPAEVAAARQVRTQRQPLVIPPIWFELPRKR